MEETEGKLNELGQRISAIEKAQLQSLELIQGEPLTKDKIEELKKSREEQVRCIVHLRSLFQDFKTESHLNVISDA